MRMGVALVEDCGGDGWMLFGGRGAERVGCDDRWEGCRCFLNRFFIPDDLLLVRVSIVRSTLAARLGGGSHIAAKIHTLT